MRKINFGDLLLVRYGVISLLCGLALFAAVSVMNRRAIWLPLVEDLPLVAGESVVLKFSPEVDGNYALLIEADDTMSHADRLRYLIDWKEPSEIEADWIVTHGHEVVAAGDSADFQFIEEGPGSLMARMRRVFLRMPYGQNAKHWMTLGLAGSVTSCRCIGTFDAVVGNEYTITFTPASEYPVLTSHGVTLIVRPERRRWLAHFAKTGPLAHAALLALGLGGAMIVFGVALRRKKGTDLFLQQK